MAKKDSSAVSNNLSVSKQQLRDLITDTAMTMFKQNGIRSVTMDELSSHLAISKRTVYELFEDKESLLLYGMARDKDRESAEFADMDKSGLSILDLALRFYKKVIDEHKSICSQFYLDLEKYPRALALIKEFHRRDRNNAHTFYRRGVEEGMFRSDINYEVLDVILPDTAKPLPGANVLLRYGLDQVFKTLMMILLRGIATPEGQKKIEEFLRTHPTL